MKIASRDRAMTDTDTQDHPTTEKEAEGIALLQSYAEDLDGKEILRRFARSIQVANEFDSKQWMPTARHHAGWTVTLRIGTTQAIILGRDLVSILLASERLDDQVQAALDEAAQDKWEESKQLPGSRYDLSWADARKLWGPIESAHHELLRHKRRATKTRNPEAKSLINFLNRKLELDLPYPRQPGSTDPTIEDCLRLLTRIEVPGGQRQLYRALLATGPEGATTQELISTMGRRDDKDLQGLLGALGHRVNGTDGYGATHKPGIGMILDVDEAIGRHGWRYRLKSVMRDALAVHAPSWLPKDLLPPPPHPNGGRFSDLLRKLDEDGLLFSPEVIANYILALQAKRFAILTGISGTGKTRIAMAVARSFRATIRDRRAADPDAATVPEGAVRMTARPYNFKYRQIMLPMAFVAGIDHFLIPDENSNGGPITVSYPGGRAQLRFWQDPKPNRNATALLFGGAHDFRDWYSSNLEPDDHFYISSREGSRPGDHRLELSLTETKEAERDLDNYTVVPVRPDWVDNRGLLGYLNPITGRYSVTPFLSLLLEARDEEVRAAEDGRDPHPFFVVLDEMNLARVEHYFSDFLSALESGERIPLHESEEVEEGETESESDPVVPRQLRIPKNVFFTGTVNVDETTYMFSPKVLDRAFTIEFDQVDLKGYTDGEAPSQSGGLDLGADEVLALGSFEKPGRNDWVKFCELDGGRYGKILRRLHGVLEEEHRHFGYRVANEIARFVNLAHAQSSGDKATVRAAFDLALRQKVLPKFHGTQQELEPLLRRLFNFALDGKDGGSKEANVKLDDWRVSRGRLSWAGKPKPTPGGSVPAGTPPAAADEPADGGEGETKGSTTTADVDSAATEIDASEGTAASAGARPEGRDPEFPRTAAKLWRMLKRLEQRGFTSFIE